ncbi:fluoride efflux transporter CrcB [Oceanobacillus halophilus]|uniref:Fluoride-specific ion channel FluC n=1 Tax=Oceanobacillus halophilus TaxID=930130 RepID=A0A495AAB5_9BACI|nr:fluoride efflux transporter CrcB [Oceanobacillus halophilus]RKQ35496.1 fluoride efflux transporter CrcB [Oceanobacillus halophilus]
MSKRINNKIYIAVGIGGMIGAISRYGVSTVFSSFDSFPFGTLTANLLGCFLLSYLLNQKQLKRLLSLEVNIGLTTGIIGAFTTYSTFAVETLELMKRSVILAILYILISILGGLAFCYLGFHVAKRKKVA